MTAAMTTSKTTTTIMIVVALSFLGSAPWVILVLSEKKGFENEISASKTTFPAKTQMINE